MHVFDEKNPEFLFFLKSLFSTIAVFHSHAAGILSWNQPVTETIPQILKCLPCFHIQTADKRRYSLAVTSVRIWGEEVDRTTPPPLGYTEEEWSRWDYNYNVTAEVSYVTTTQNFCEGGPSVCEWPNVVPNIVWHDGTGPLTSVCFCSSFSLLVCLVGHGQEWSFFCFTFFLAQGKAILRCLPSQHVCLMVSTQPQSGWTTQPWFRLYCWRFSFSLLIWFSGGFLVKVVLTMRWTAFCVRLTGFKTKLRSHKSAAWNQFVWLVFHLLWIILLLYIDFLMCQREFLFSRYKYDFRQYDFQDNSYERSYPQVTFHCYPAVSWLFTQKRCSCASCQK